MSAPTLQTLYKAITDVLRERPLYASLVTQHIVAAHGIHTLPAFLHTSNVAETEKMETFKKIIRGLAAHIEGKPHGLLGATAAGQAETPVEEPVVTTSDGVTVKPIADIPAFTPDPEPSAEAEAQIETPKPAAAKPRAPKPAAATDDPITARFRELIIEIVGPLDARLDEDAVNKLIAAALKQHDIKSGETLTKIIDALKKSLQSTIASMREALEEKLKNLPAGQSRTLEIKIGKAVNKVEGLTHRQFMQFATWIAADVPVWAWGPAGGGKTTLGEQVAQALGIPFCCISIDETITVGKLVGFKNLSNGEYVEGLLYQVYKNGGLALLDEIDTNSTTMASLNAMLANDHYTFGNGERVKRHADFRVMAGANTKGTGAVAGYTARVRLDAATLDRFAVIELAYDWDMVEGIALGKQVNAKPWTPVAPADAATLDRWVGWVKAVSQRFGKDVLISPRAALLGTKALRAGVPIDEVAECLVFKLMTADTRTKVLSQFPLPASVAAAA